MKKKTKLPFSMMPASWGLNGKSRLRAEAEYYYAGEDLEKKLAVIDADNEDEAQIAELRVDLKNENIGKVEFEKKVAGIRKEPWVNVLELGVNPENAQAGYIELDWNDEFVLMLHNNGYTAQSDEEVSIVDAKRQDVENMRELLYRSGDEGDDARGERKGEGVYDGGLFGRGRSAGVAEHVH